MVCEHLQTNIIREDDLALTILLAVMCSTRIQLCEQETSLTTTLIALDDLWDWTPVGNECLSVLDRSCQQRFEVLMSWIVLQTSWTQ